MFYVFYRIMYLRACCAYVQNLSKESEKNKMSTVDCKISVDGKPLSSKACTYFQNLVISLYRSESPYSFEGEYFSRESEKVETFYSLCEKLNVKGDITIECSGDAFNDFYGSIPFEAFQIALENRNRFVQYRATVDLTKKPNLAYTKESTGSRKARVTSLDDLL